MSISERLNHFQPQALALLRIMAALLFLAHGTMKLFAFPGPQPGLPDPIPTLFLVGALIELVGGALVAIGLFTRPVAFLLSGQMAVAYFMFHFPKSFYPSLNGGDAAVLYCFIFLLFVFSGPGAWSVDSREA